jgi:hypothetical protein
VSELWLRGQGDTYREERVKREGVQKGTRHQNPLTGKGHFVF